MPTQADDGDNRDGCYRPGGRMTASKLRGAFLVSSAAILLAGCTSLFLPTPPPLDTYSLTAPEVDAVGGKSRLQLLVNEPTALKDLDSQNIVVRTGPAEIQYLAGAQWSDRLPAVVQARLIETFERNGGFAGVGRPGQGLAIDYQILVDIRDLAVNGKPGASRAAVAITVKILDDRNGSLRGTRTFEATRGVSGQDNRDYARALDAAFGEVAAGIVGWVAQTI